MSDELGRAVLELRTDGAQFFADLERARASGKELGTTFDRTGQSADRAGQQQRKLGDLTSGLGGTFGAVTRIAGAFGLALSLEGAIAGVKRLFDYAEQVHNVAEGSRMSAQAVQELGAAGARVGVDMETMATGVFQLSRRIAEGDTAAVAAAQSLGLNVKQLRTLAPDQMFDKVAAALKRVADPLQQARLATDLFGRGASQLMALINAGVPEARKFAEQMGLVASDASIARMHNLGEQVAVMTTQMKVGAIEAIASVLQLLHLGQETPRTGPQRLLRQPGEAGTPIAPSPTQAKQQAEGLLAVASAFRINADAVRNVAAGAEHALSTQELLQNRLKALRDEALIPLTDQERTYVRVLHDAGLGEAEIAKELDAPIQAVSKYVKVLQDAEQKQKQYDEAVKAATASEIALSAQQELDIQYYQKRGLNEQQIALLVKASEAAVRSYTTGLRDREQEEQRAATQIQQFHLKTVALWEEVAKAQQKITNESTAEQLKAYTDFHAKNADLALQGADLEVAQIERARDADLEATKLRFGAESNLTRMVTAEQTKYYQHLIDMANRTSGTLEARLAAQGVFTQKTLAGLAGKEWADYYQMVAEKGKWTTAQLEAQLDRAKAATAAALGVMGKTWDQTFKTIFDQIPQILEQAFTGGGGVAGAGKAIGVLIGKEIGAQIGMAIGKQIGNAIGDTAKKSAGQWGEEIGGAIFPIFAAAIGLAIGMIIDALSHRTEKDVFLNIGQRWGVEISDGLKQEIADQAKKVGDEVAAEFLSLGKIIDEAGGVTKTSMAKWTKALTDAFAVAVWDAHYTKDDLQKTFNDVFPKLTAIVTKEGGIWSAQFQNLINQARIFGLELDDVNSLLTDQVTTIGTGLAAQLAPLTAKYGGLTQKIADQRAVIADLDKQVGSPEVLKALLEQNQAVKDAQQAVDDLVAAGKAGTDEYRLAVVNLTLAQQNQNQFAKDYEKEVAKLNGLLDEQAAGAADAQASLDRVGQAALASYNAGIAKGLDQLTLLEDLGPALDNLVSLEQTLGMESKNAAVQELIALRTKLDANKELAAAATSWGQTYAAMVNLGVTDTDALLAMQRQGVDDYDKLIAAGLTEKEALAQIKAGLQAVYDAHVKTGEPIDENTQKLIDQAKAYGLISDKSKSLGDIFTGVGKNIVDAVDRLTAAIGEKLAPATEGLWDSSGAAGKLEKKYHAGGPISAEVAGSQFRDVAGTIRAHHGLALGEVPLIGQAGEDIWSRDDVARWGGLANVEHMRTGGPGDGAAIGGTTLNVTFQITTPDKRGFDALLEQEIEPRLVDIWRRGGGQRTRARASLGLQTG